MERDNKHLFCAMQTENIGHSAQMSNLQTIPNKWNKTHLTYKIVKDSKQIPGGSFEKYVLNLAVRAWELYLPLNFENKLDGETDISIIFSDNDPYFKEYSSTLAYAYYPETENAGTIVFNDNKPWSTWSKDIHNLLEPDNTKDVIYNITSTFIHEIGHCLGLTHSTPDTIMSPYYNGLLEIQADDRMKIQKKYGVRNEKIYMVNRKLDHLKKRIIDPYDELSFDEVTKKYVVKNRRHHLKD